jgi:hypothetical protein
MLFLDLPFELLKLLQMEVGIPRLQSQRGLTLHCGSNYNVDGNVDTGCLLGIPGGMVSIAHEAPSGWVDVVVRVGVGPPKGVIIVEEATQIFRVIKFGVGSGYLALVRVGHGLLLII